MSLNDVLGITWYIKSSKAQLLLPLCPSCFQVITLFVILQFPWVLLFLFWDFHLYTEDFDMGTTDAFEYYLF